MHNEEKKHPLEGLFVCVYVCACNEQCKKAWQLPFVCLHKISSYQREREHGRLLGMQALWLHVLEGYSHGSEYLGKELTNAGKLKRKVCMDTKQKKKSSLRSKITMFFSILLLFK